MIAELVPIAVPLHCRDGTVRAWTIVDADDYEWAMQYRWSLNDTGYVTRNAYYAPGRKLMSRLHRKILGLKFGDPREGDHENGDKLDNRRPNLRVGTKGENMQNRRGARRNTRSQVRGVIWDASRRKWAARAQLDGKTHNLGRFATIAEAEAVVVAWRREHMPFSEMDRLD